MNFWSAMKGVFRRWTPASMPIQFNRLQPVAEMPPEASWLLPVRGLGELFPGIEVTEVRFPVSRLVRQGEWTLPLAELLTLAAICRYTRPQRIYEMGTYTGATILGMAMNAPYDAEVFTLDLDAAERAALRTSVDGADASAFVVGAHYRDTPFASRVHQLFGNTVTFDHSPYYGSMDLVLIDANHTYLFVKRDTENAFRLIRPGGIIVWDDYVWEAKHRECAGVTQCLNELAASRPVFQIRGTRLAIYLDGMPGRAEARP